MLHFKVLFYCTWRRALCGNSFSRMHEIVAHLCAYKRLTVAAVNERTSNSYKKSTLEETGGLCQRGGYFCQLGWLFGAKKASATQLQPLRRR